MSQESKPIESIYIKEVCTIGDLKKGAVKISPIGKVTGIDGRKFTIDGGALLQDLQANGLKIVLNIEHGYSSKHGGEAAGWFDDFELRDAGIYAKLKLNKVGKKLLEAKAYKYLSPEYLTDLLGTVHHIIGVGLVNSPNLLNEALNQVHPKHHKNNDELQGDNTMSQAEKDELKKLKEDNCILQEKLDAQDVSLRTTRIDNAIFEGKLLPAKKEFALALDTNALEGFLTMEAESTTLKKDDNGLNPDAAGDDAGNEIYKQLGI